MADPTIHEKRAEADEEVFIRSLVHKHGGMFHGPRVEHISMEEQAFYRMMREFREVALARHCERVAFYIDNPTLYPGHPLVTANENSGG